MSEILSDKRNESLKRQNGTRQKYPFLSKRGRTRRTFAVNIFTLGSLEEHLDPQRLGLVAVEQMEAQVLRLVARQVDGVVAACSDDAIESGDAFLTGVSQTPAVVHGSVQEVDVAVSVQCYRGEPPCLRVFVHALDHQHHVVERVARVGVPARIPVTCRAGFRCAYDALVR